MTESMIKQATPGGNQSTLDDSKALLAW